MTCHEAREAMLVAEPEALQSGDGGLLEQHLSECATCRATAGRLSRDLELLSAAVFARHRGRTRRVALVASIPAGAALVVAATVLHGHGEQAEPVHAATTNTEKIVSVDIKRGQQATVLRTSDPTVTVVWISQESES
jgi:hypothetical protein